MHEALGGLDDAIVAIAASDTKATVQILKNAVEDGDIIFVKGSLGSGSWRVRDAILASFDTASSPDTSSKNGGDSHAA
jgi:type II secretory pathway predicted ATPase ExeA